MYGMTAKVKKQEPEGKAPAPVKNIRF